MIAARAGQPFSLVVFDEIFASLDQARREGVLSLLQRLRDRFPQVIVTTHVELPAGLGAASLDRLIHVSYDPTSGASVVRDDTPTLGSPDASVAA